MEREHPGTVTRDKPPPAEPVDQLFFDLQCALERKRIDAETIATALVRRMLPAARTLRVETLYHDAQVRNRQLCQALQRIADACGPGAVARADTIAALGHLARAALETAQHRGGPSGSGHGFS